MVKHCQIAASDSMSLALRHVSPTICNNIIAADMMTSNQIQATTTLSVHPCNK